MYSREEQIRAIELWLKYGKRTMAVIRELGYPSRRLIPIWYKDYLKEQETGVIQKRLSEKHRSILICKNR